MRKNAERFFKSDGGPKYLRCYEVKRNPTVDRFTIVFTRASCFLGRTAIGTIYYVGASGYPTSPTGFYQHGTADSREFHAPGSRVSFFSLPQDLQDVVMDEYRQVWDLY
jgi:hypothetical protein